MTLIYSISDRLALILRRRFRAAGVWLDKCHVVAAERTRRGGRPTARRVGLAITHRESQNCRSTPSRGPASVLTRSYQQGRWVRAALGTERTQPRRTARRNGSR